MKETKFKTNKLIVYSRSSFASASMSDLTLQQTKRNKRGKRRKRRGCRINQKNEESVIIGNQEKFAKINK